MGIMYHKQKTITAMTIKLIDLSQINTKMLKHSLIFLLLHGKIPIPQRYGLDYQEFRPLYRIKLCEGMLANRVTHAGEYSCRACNNGFI